MATPRCVKQMRHPAPMWMRSSETPSPTGSTSPRSPRSSRLIRAITTPRIDASVKWSSQAVNSGSGLTLNTHPVYSSDYTPSNPLGRATPSVSPDPSSAHAVALSSLHTGRTGAPANGRQAPPTGPWRPTADLLVPIARPRTSGVRRTAARRLPATNTGNRPGTDIRGPQLAASKRPWGCAPGPGKRSRSSGHRQVGGLLGDRGAPASQQRPKTQLRTEAHPCEVGASSDWRVSGHQGLRAGHGAIASA